MKLDGPRIQKVEGSTCEIEQATRVNAIKGELELRLCSEFKNQ